MVKEKYLPYEEPEQQAAPPKTPAELKKEKRENFWYYNKTKILVSIFVVVAVLLTWQPWVTEIDPDYTVGLMSQKYWSHEQVEKLESLLSPYGKDLNGDGIVKVNVSFYQLYAPESAGLGAQEVQAFNTRFAGDLQTGDVIMFIGDKTNIERNGINEGLFARVDDMLTLVKEGEKVSAEDISVDWKTCDAISKSKSFSNLSTDYYFAIRGKEGTVENRETEYLMAAELFFRLTKNEPYDAKLLDSLLRIDNTASDGASSGDASQTASAG